MLTQMQWMRIVENQGATLDVVVYNGKIMDVQSKDYQTGYAVSIKGHELKYQRSLNNDILIGYIKSNMVELDEQPHARVGIWFDGDCWYLDISHIYTGIHNAIDIARQQEQKAIYDFSRKVSIDVNTMEVIK